MTIELRLGGMALANNHGDIDIYDRDGRSITRLQRADIPDIIEFLTASREDAV